MRHIRANGSARHSADGSGEFPVGTPRGLVTFCGGKLITPRHDMRAGGVVSRCRKTRGRSEALLLHLRPQSDCIGTSASGTGSSPRSTCTHADGQRVGTFGPWVRTSGSHSLLGGHRELGADVTTSTRWEA
jgi:hypothetical protein